METLRSRDYVSMYGASVAMFCGSVAKSDAGVAMFDGNVAKPDYVAKFGRSVSMFGASVAMFCGSVAKSEAGVANLNAPAAKNSKNGPASIVITCFPGRILT